MHLPRPFMHHSFSASKEQISKQGPLSHFPIHIDWRSFFRSPPTTGLNSGEAWCEAFSFSNHFSPPFSKLNQKSYKQFNPPSPPKSHGRSNSLNLTTHYPSNPLSPSSSSGPYTFTDLHLDIRCNSSNMDLYDERVFFGTQKNTPPNPTPNPLEQNPLRSASLPVYTKSHQQTCNRPSLDIPKISLEGRNCSSTALTLPIADKLSHHLPSRHRLSKSWKLLYNIDQHGLSLSTMFRRCKDQGPCIIAIRDSDDQLFGAYISDPLEPSPSYYGSGEWAETGNDGSTQVVTYEWSGLNRYLILCEPEYISIGGGDGKYGLWLDSEFDRGISQTCSTFHNQPLAGPQEEFQCIEFEVWGIGS